jgi:Holliday junction resolvase RusA-like endonuclease
MTAFTFVVPTTPRVKERPRLGRRRKAFTPERTLIYEASVRKAYVDAGGPTFGVPVSVYMELFADSAIVSIVPQMVVYKSKLRGDVDNLAKAVLDGLQGAAYENDSTVVGVFAWKA